MFKSIALSGVVPGILSFAGALSLAFGSPALNAFFSDPATVQNATGLVTAGLALWAGLANGVLKKPDAK